ncbi:Protein-tyrosine phosphatase containing protein [Aphelenchoides avenae]|nr:Protein-tyrosine phosphatase containing protein [Aphelenchus avenae]
MDFLGKQLQKMAPKKKKDDKKNTGSRQAFSDDESTKTADNDAPSKRPVRKINHKSTKPRTPSAKTPDTGSSGSGRSQTKRDPTPRQAHHRRAEAQHSRLLTVGARGLLAEYTQQIRAYVPPNATFNAFSANADKNRYHDVMCMDATRVKLRNRPADYIHASHVRGPPLRNNFICTQGPMRGTVCDFWAMAVQEDVGQILMLCETVENGIEKCHQYWPAEVNGALGVGGFTVKNTNVERRDGGLIVTTLEVQSGRSGEPRTVRHYQWRSWPDKSVPQSYLAPLRMLRAVRHSKRTTIVHCSAGIGRTGSLVALELALQTALAEKELSMPTVIKQLRDQRVHCIQTDLQYLYIHECLRVYCQKFNITKDDGPLSQKSDEFAREYQQILDERLPKDQQKAYDEFRPAQGFLPPLAR